MSEVREGIILRTTPYGESRVILNVLTPDLGTIGLIATLSKSGKSGLKKAHFQSLQILEIKHAAKAKGELKRLQDARIIEPYQHLYFDPILSCLSLFLAEFLAKILQEEEGNTELYTYIRSALMNLDASEHSPANFHLSFLINLCPYLGCAPDLGLDEPYMDLMNGEVSHRVPEHPHFIEAEELAAWRELQNKGLQNWESAELKGSDLRRRVLSGIIDYYRLQVHDFGELKSLSVLREVLA